MLFTTWGIPGLSGRRGSYCRNSVTGNINGFETVAFSNHGIPCNRPVTITHNYFGKAVLVTASGSISAAWFKLTIRSFDMVENYDFFPIWNYRSDLPPQLPHPTLSQKTLNDHSGGLSEAVLANCSIVAWSNPYLLVIKWTQPRCARGC